MRYFGLTNVPFLLHELKLDHPLAEVAEKKFQ